MYKGNVKGLGGLNKEKAKEFIKKTSKSKSKKNLFSKEKD